MQTRIVFVSRVKVRQPLVPKLTEPYNMLARVLQENEVRALTREVRSSWK